MGRSTAARGRRTWVGDGKVQVRKAKDAAVRPHSATVVLRSHI